MAFTFGPQFLINTQTTSDQEDVSLAGLANGLFVAAYEGGSGFGDAIRFQVFNADGGKRGAETILTSSSQGNTLVRRDPDVAAAPDASFFIAGDVGNSGVNGGRHTDIDLNILPNGGIGSSTKTNNEVATAVRSDGGRFAVYQSSNLTPGADDPDIRGNFFIEGHTNAVGAFDNTINSGLAGSDARPDVAALENGRFVTVWESGINVTFRFTSVTYGQDPNNPNNPSAAITTHLGTDTFVATGSRPVVAALPGGKFVVLWYNDGGGSPNRILGRVYDENGNSSGLGLGDFVAATDVNRQGADRDIAVTVFKNGQFAVGWTGLAGTINGDTSGTYIDVGIFNSKAHPELSAFTVIPSIAKLTNQSLTGITAGDQFDPSLTALADGRFVLGWTDASASAIDTLGLAVRGRIIDTRTNAVAILGTPGHDDYLGTEFNDTIKSLGGADKLIGGDGDDILDGGAGTDTLDGGPGDEDTAVFSGARGNYQVVVLANGDIRFTDLRAGSPDGTDTVFNVEKFRFSDGIVTASTLFDVAPVITSDGGGSTATVSISENTFVATTVTATDPDPGTTLTYLIVGGADRTKFRVQATTGVLAFQVQPDFEAPTDSDGNNSYVVQVRALDGNLFDDQIITVNVTDVSGLSSPVDDSDPLFDTAFYLRHNPDVEEAHANALFHFDTAGFREGRDPNVFFDTSGYLAVNKDVAASGVNPLDHFHRSGWQQGRDPGPDFDTTLYLLRNPDVAAAGIDPLEHFLQSGQFEGRQAFAAIGQEVVGGFDAEFYLFHNPDVAAAGIDPLLHYNVAGRYEGRNPNAYFDTAGYLSHYADVAAAGGNPLQHYEQFGWLEGRDPSAGFDTLGYLAANPDVAAAHVNPLDHFLTFGIYEGRHAINDGLFH